MATIFLACNTGYPVGTFANSQDIATHSKEPETLQIPTPPSGPITSILHSLALQDSSTRQNAWFYFLSSLSQAVASGSALFFAIVVFRLQTISGNLSKIEIRIAKLCSEKKFTSQYSGKAEHAALNEDWIEYFATIKTLQPELVRLASVGTATGTNEMITRMVEKGQLLFKRYSKIHGQLLRTFLVTVVVVGASIMGIPAVGLVTELSIVITWGACGAMLLLLCFFHYKLLRSLF